MVNDKVICIIFFSIFIFLFSIVCSGCASTKTRDDSGVIEQTSRAAGQLEKTVDYLDRTADDCRKRITDAVEYSKGITDGIERFEYLFNQYEQTVNELLNEIDYIRNEIKTGEESSHLTSNDCDTSDNVYFCNDIP